MSYLRILPILSSMGGGSSGGPVAFDLSGNIKWRPMKIRTNDLVGPLSGMSYPARAFVPRGTFLPSQNAVQRKDICFNSRQFPHHKKENVGGGSSPNFGLRHRGKNQSSARV